MTFEELVDRAKTQDSEANGAVFIDANAGLCDADGNLKAEYTVEGMHMYANGYRAVLQNLLPTLRSCHG